jgi:hypothetical protein
MAMSHHLDPSIAIWSFDDFVRNHLQATGNKLLHARSMNLQRIKNYSRVKHTAAADMP